MHILLKLLEEMAILKSRVMLCERDNGTSGSIIGNEFLDHVRKQLASQRLRFME
jgi:hypothetical protein